MSVLLFQTKALLTPPIEDISYCAPFKKPLFVRLHEPNSIRLDLIEKIDTYIKNLDKTYLKDDQIRTKLNNDTFLLNAKNKTQRYFITNPKAFYDFALGLFSQKVDSSFDNEKYKYPNKSNEIMDNWINNEKDSKFIQILNLFKENVYNNQSAAMDQANAVVRNKDFVKYYWDSVETFINTNNKKDYIQFNKKNDCKLLDDVKNNIDAYTDYIPDKDLVEYIKSIL